MTGNWQMTGCRAGTGAAGRGKIGRRPLPIGREARLGATILRWESRAAASDGSGPGGGATTGDKAAARGSSGDVTVDPERG